MENYMEEKRTRHGIQKERICKFCGGVFMAARSDAMSCSVCRNNRDVVRPGVGTGNGDKPQRKLQCIECGKTIFAARSDKKYCNICSHKRRLDQYNKSDHKTRYDTCLCGNRKAKVSTLCMECRGEIRKTETGDKNHNWKGGRTKSKGYFYIKNTTRPEKSRYRGEHIVVWEEHNGPLPDDWVVHHLNGIKDDNRIENLAGMPRLQHHHHPREALVPYEQRIQQLEAIVAALSVAL